MELNFALVTFIRRPLTFMVDLVLMLFLAEKYNYLRNSKTECKNGCMLTHIPLMAAAKANTDSAHKTQAKHRKLWNIVLWGALPKSSAHIRKNYPRVLSDKNYMLLDNLFYKCSLSHSMMASYF